MYFLPHFFYCSIRTLNLYLPLFILNFKVCIFSIFYSTISSNWFLTKLICYNPVSECIAELCGFKREILNLSVYICYRCLEYLGLSHNWSYVLLGVVYERRHERRHASPSYYFGRTYSSRRHARWLLNTYNNHHDFLVRSENVRMLRLTQFFFRPVISSLLLTVLSCLEFALIMLW